MKRLFLFAPCFLMSVALAFPATCGAADAIRQAPLRQRNQLNDDWKFVQSDPAQAEAVDCDESTWQAVTLPHDWSIGGRIDPKAPMGGCGGFFPAGVGWYRRQIDAPADWKAKRVALEFDGVYMNADIYFNGQKLANHPYGFTGFFVDLTPALKPGASNVLAVRVDNSDQKNCRWYTGSGIYRHVWLHVTEPIHVSPWGVFAYASKADEQSATVTVQTKILNETADSKEATVETTLLGPGGETLGQSRSTCSLVSSGTAAVAQQFELKTPPLWSPEHPRQSRAVTRVLVDGKAVDEVTTNFGIRSLTWNAENGLMLNGKTIKLNGGCVHHDNGILGACAFDRAEERKIELLKAAGFNAIRTAHNPPSSALLDACDRLGMMVLDEAFDTWSVAKGGKRDYSFFFKKWWERDVDSMVMRDRNHPSVVMWSIGNEVPEVYFPPGEENGPKLAARIRMLDPTRPVTNGILGWPVDERHPKPEDEAKQRAADANWNSLDIVGTNYTLAAHLRQHEKHPSRILVSTESFPPLGLPAEVLKHPYVVGDFVWAAQDYLGEAGVGRWFYEGDPTEPLRPPRPHEAGKPEAPRDPVQHGSDSLYPWRGAACGNLDLLGNLRPAGHWRKIAWDAGEKLSFAVRQPSDDKKIVVVPWGWYPAFESWTWPGREGKPMEVEVYSRYEEVRLYLNGQRIEPAPHSDNGQYRTVFKLSYQPGTLKAVGVQGGQEVEERQLATVGEPASLRLVPDRAALKPDGQDLSFVSIEVVDADGQLQPNADHEITFSLEGPGVIAGLGNANLKGTEPYQGSKCHVFHGRAMIVIRAEKTAGTVVLKATGPGLKPATTTLDLEAIKSE